MKEYLNKKILVVDDVPMSLVYLTNQLEKMGYTNITKFSDSVEAWEDFAQAVLTDHPYDLVITDLNMPGLDGMDFISQIKNDDMSKDTNIIVVSADHDPLVIDEAMDLGVSGYVTKPIDLNELQEQLEFAFKGLPFEISS